MVARGSCSNGRFFSVFLVRCLVYVFYITGGPRDLVPYIPTLATTKEIRKCLFTCFLYKFSLKCLCFRVIIIVRTGFYVKIEVRSLLILLTFNWTSQGMKHRIIGQLSNCLTPIDWSELSHKNIPLVIFILLTIIAFKIRDILTYSLVLLILCIVYRLISRFAIYKAPFALIAIFVIVR